MRLNRVWICCLLSVYVAAAQEGPAPTPTLDFKTLLKQLNDENFQTRQEASAHLRNLPASALPELESALKDPSLDPEVRNRLLGAHWLLKLKARRLDIYNQANKDLDWTHKSMVDGFESFGAKDPKWDQDAREGLVKLVNAWRKGQARDLCLEAFESLNKAANSGCRDPMVLYGRARLYDVVIRKELKVGIEMQTSAVQGVKESGYHPMRKAYSYAYATKMVARKNITLTDEQIETAKQWLVEGKAVWLEACKDPEVPAVCLHDVAEIFIQSSHYFNKDGAEQVETYSRELKTARTKSGWGDHLKGNFYVDYAWEARGGGWASSVTEDGWKLFKDRLDVAAAALTSAYEIEPLNRKASLRMMSVELGQNQGRERLDLWYRRAREADPDSMEVIRSKLWYLMPRWHGSHEEMRQFGHELLVEGDWETSAPMHLIEIHRMISGDKKDAKHYLEPEVWKELSMVYEAAVQVFPKEMMVKSGYCAAACQCEQWAVAKKLFDELGDKVEVKAFGTKKLVDQMRTKARQEAP